MDLLIFHYHRNNRNLYHFWKLLSEVLFFVVLFWFVLVWFFFCNSSLWLKESFPTLWSISRITQSSIFKLFWSLERFTLLIFYHLHILLFFTLSHTFLESYNEDLMTSNIEEFKLSMLPYLAFKHTYIYVFTARKHFGCDAEVSSRTSGFV